MNYAAIPLLLALLGAATAPAQDFPALSEEEYRKAAAEALRNADYTVAEFAYRDFYKAYPGNPDALFGLAGVLQRVSRDAEALALMRQAQDRFGGLPGFHIEMGRLLMVHQPPDAVREFQRAAALAAPTSRSAGLAHNWLGALYESMGRLDEAVAEFRKARPIVGPSLMMGETLFLTGDVDGAVAIYRGVLKNNPENWAAMGDLALVLVERPGGQEEALRLAQREVELAPEIFVSHDLLGVIHTKRGEFEQAEDAFFASLRTEGGTILPNVRQHLADEMDTRNLWTGDRRELRRLLTAEQTATNVARMMELLAQTAPSNSDTLVTK